MLKKSIISLITFSILLMICYFLNWLDLFLAKIPYNDKTKLFYGETHLWCKVIYYSVPFIVTAMICLILIMIIFFNFAKNSTNINLIAKKQIITILILLIIGPGILVNVILKDNWGRPRPYQVIRDNEDYKAFYQPNFGARNDNSFPSGHASIGFFLGVPLLIIGRRKIGIIVAILAGSLIGCVRILQGGHFLSDVLFSGIIIWFSAEIINYFFTIKN